MHRDDRIERLAQRLKQLVAAHSQAVALFREIVSALSEDLGLYAVAIASSTAATKEASRGRSVGQSPLADPDTLAIHWKGKTCFLGKTLAFRLFARLACRPNHYLAHDLLLDDVWERRVTKEAIRSVVKTLKQKLRQAGMEDLAAAIDGRRRECYGLILDRRS